MDIWKPVPGFRGYSVSNYGLVRNDDSGRVLTVRRNGHGTCYVGMQRGRRQVNRSLAPLVAAAHVPKISRPDFTSLIHVDGYSENNRADNLMWRPHWFVVKYLNQMVAGARGSDIPVKEIKTNENYPTTWDASLAYGLLELDLIASIINRTFVWPTFQEFRYIAE